MGFIMVVALLSKISLLYRLLSNASYILSSFIIIFSGREKGRKQTRNSRGKKVLSYYYGIILSMVIMQALCLRLWIKESSQIWTPLYCIRGNINWVNNK